MTPRRATSRSKSRKLPRAIIKNKAEISPSPLWERREGEPNKLFDRFEIYRLLGPSRSLYSAYIAWRERSGAKSAQKRAGLPQSWRQAAERWEWAKRAEAFDEHERAQQIAEWQRRRDDWSWFVS